MTLFGVLTLDKPPGPTSRDAIDAVARCIRPNKVGHAGTLDPLACGVLVACLGPATKLIQYIQRMPKTYLAEFQLGVQSPTDDIESTPTPLDDAPQPARSSLDQACRSLVGRIRQRPPDYSAAKVGGRRAYALAREGQSFQLQAREVEIYSIDILRYDYPHVEMLVTCGSGTYIRSLGRDLAECVGTVAVMTALCRTAVGRFQLSDALALDEVSTESIVANLRDPVEAVHELPRRRLNASEVALLARGQPIETGVIGSKPTVTENTQEIAGLDARGKLVALLHRWEDGSLWPAKNFPRVEPPGTDHSPNS